jgi:hypothetical protein
MLHFRNYSDSYVVSAQHILPDDEVFSYSGKIDIEAVRINKECYHFTMKKRHDVRIDDGDPEHGSDIMMKEIGDSLYPLKFVVSDTGKITDIINFEEIKERWTEKRNELIKNHYTSEFEQYMKASAHNMDDKQRFFEVLQRDVFIQFFFLAFENNMAEFHLYHFPKYGYKTACYAVKSHNAAMDNYTIHPAFVKRDVIKTDGTLLYERSKEGDLRDMLLQIDMLMNDQTYYRRRISIRRDENFDRTVNLWF